MVTRKSPSRLFQVKVLTDKGRKADLVDALHASSALNKVQKAPSGYHWEECTKKEVFSKWGAKVEKVRGEYTYFKLEDNG